jgi:hypothetical protein
MDNGVPIDSVGGSTQEPVNLEDTEEHDAPPECLQPITTAALCTVAINLLVPRAFNPKSQYLIPFFNKIS